MSGTHAQSLVTSTLQSPMAAGCYLEGSEAYWNILVVSGTLDAKGSMNHQT